MIAKNDLIFLYLATLPSVWSNIINKKKHKIPYWKSSSLKLISDLSGLKTHNKSKAIALLVLFFSLAGIPPFAGFFAKFFILTASMNEGFIYLSLIAVLSSVIAAFYYLKVIKNMFFNEGEENLIKNSMFYNSLTYIVCSLFVTLFAFYPDPIILIINNYFN